MAKTQCLFCNKDIYDKPSHINLRKYCSIKCRYSSPEFSASYNNCLVCNLRFRRWGNNKKNNIYCSRKCQSEHKSLKARIKTECLACGKDFYQESWRGKKFCKKSCFWSFNQGENNSGWKDDSANKNARERRIFMTKIRETVLKRDDYTCQICYKKGGKLQVDHIQSWAEYIELRFSMDNCRTVCIKCHYKITFGKEMTEKGKRWGGNVTYTKPS